MLPAVAVAVVGVWLLVQATGGRLPARLLSYRASAEGVPTVSDAGWTSPGSSPAADLPSMTSSPAGGTLSGPQVARMVLNAGFTDEAAAIAVAIAYRESRFNPAAHNPVPPDDSYGLWQINRLAHPQYSPAELSTPTGNLRAMIALSSNGTNWQPWTVPGASYLTNLDLPAARAFVAQAKGGR